MNLQAIAKKKTWEGSGKLYPIQEVYAGFYASILLSGKMNQRTTAAGFWAPSSTDQLYELFTRMRLSQYRHFVDLGSGDGVVAAVASLFTRATGIELDNVLYEKSVDIQRNIGLTCTFKCADFLKEDLSQYDVAFINPDDYFYKLEKKLLKEFHGILIVADHLYWPLNLQLQDEIKIGGQNFLVYAIHK